MLGAQPRQGVGMCSYTSRAAALALLVGALACSDRPPGTAPEATGGPVVLSTATNPELLARSLALALGDPTFRASVKGELDRSPYREHKLPVETGFSTDPAATICLACGGPVPWPPLPPPPPAVPGLYLTKAHFVDDFEGWLKGGPEFEVHILGQKGQTDSLTDYQCAGEKQPAPYYFDQNALDWSGSVMLFSKVQLDAYNAAHPGQNVRVFVVEDDDTACQIKADRNLLNDAIKAVDGAYKAITAGNDSSSWALKTFKRASAFQKLWTALASLINTNDELVGNAVEDVVVGISYPGYNWIVKGQNNATNGWITLAMK